MLNKKKKHFSNNSFFPQLNVIFVLFFGLEGKGEAQDESDLWNAIVPWCVSVCVTVGGHSGIIFNVEMNRFLLPPPIRNSLQQILPCSRRKHLISLCTKKRVIIYRDMNYPPGFENTARSTGDTCCLL